MASESVKKTKAPAKPKKTTAAGETAAKPKKMTAKVKKETATPVATPSHHEIAALAQRYWAERGWQDGAAEQDWLRAEQDLLGKAS